MTLLVIIGLTVLGGVLGVLGAWLVIFYFHKRGPDFIKHFVSLAAGTMFATVFLEMLPEAIEHSDNIEMILGSALVGLTFFYLTEKLFLWTHHHEDEDAARAHSHAVTVKMIMSGDTIHNFIDGIAIGAAVLISPAAGVLTALAVFIHEIPHEMGDLGTMMHMGYTKKKSLLFNVISSFASVIGGLTVYLFGMFHDVGISTILAFIAGGFLYIAGADLLPEAHREINKKSQIATHALTFVLGIVVFWLLTELLHA